MAIKVEGKKITLSRGDTLSVTFRISSGINLQPTDTVIFTIKDNPQSSAALLRKEYTGLTGTDITVEATVEEMQMTAGSKVYDLLVKNGAQKTTLMFPGEFVVAEVVHNE